MKNRTRLLLAAVMIVALSGGHYITNLGHAEVHDLFRRFYFVPIIFSAYSFGLRGGVLSAVAISLLYLPFVLFRLTDSAMRFDHYLEIALYLAMGTITGLLSSRQKQAFQRLENLTLGVIQSLISIIEARDVYTRGHSVRVMKIAGRLGQKMGLSPADLRTLKIGALLHDVGKVGIDLPILNKPSQLAGAEMDVVRKHPEWGVHFLESIEELRPVLPAVLHHHERFDGTGYPGGLKQDQIPLHARIVMVADIFDAMTTNRPYRKALALEEVTDEIGTLAGSALDPEIVQILLSKEVQALLKEEVLNKEGWYVQSDIRLIERRRES